MALPKTIICQCIEFDSVFALAENLEFTHQLWRGVFTVDGPQSKLLGYTQNDSEMGMASQCHAWGKINLT